MAEKQVVSGKLQLTVSYTDENNKKKNRELSFAKVKAGATAAGLMIAAQALASLQEDDLEHVKETVQYEITA